MAVLTICFLPEIYSGINLDWYEFVHFSKSFCIIISIETLGDYPVDLFWFK